MGHGESTTARGRARLIEQRRVLRRGFAEVGGFDLEICAVVLVAMHPLRPREYPPRPVAQHRPVFPAPLPQLVDDLHVLHAYRGGNRADGYASTSDQRFQKHVRGAGQLPSPPVAGCRPALVSPPQERTRQATRSRSSAASARASVRPVSGCSRYCFLSGACSARNSFAFIVL